MPSLSHLLQELKEIPVDPSEIRLPGALYDSLLEQVETAVDEQEDEN